MASSGGPACTTRPPRSPAPGPSSSMKSACRIAASVVLDDDDGVAHLAEPPEQREQAIGVARVQSDGGLVEHVERIHEPRAERVGERDALRLAAGEGAGLAVEGQVAQSHIEQIVEEASKGVEDGRSEWRAP